MGPTGNGRNPKFNGRRQPSIDGTSRMMREYQVRICERLGVKFPRPTRPGCVKTCWSQGCAELLSQFPSLDRAGKCNWFSHRQNREGISTRKLNVRVFTQPGSGADSPDIGAG